jgi:hypothetical protein
MIDRSKYYSLTEVVKKFKISRLKYHQLLKEKEIPFESVPIDFGNYQMETIYVKKEIIESLLELRQP